MKTLKKVLFIAYQFPPQGGPGVQRSTRFVQHLQEFGYMPYVLTVDEKEIQASGAVMDSSLLERIPSDVSVYRVRSGQFPNMVRLLNKLKIYRVFWYFLYPFFWERSALWPSVAYKTAAAVIKENGIKMIYTSSGPFSALLLGYKLKRKLGVKWVADMRDPFTDAYAWSFPSKLHWYFSRMIEKKVLGFADELVVNTPEVKKLYTYRGIKKAEHIHVVTNGY